MKRLLVLAASLAFCASSMARTYPTQPIRLVIPYPPAGATDTLARLVADQITGGASWVFVTDNKPGAGGNIGMDAVAKARADGYTLGIGQTANLAIHPTLYAKVPYDALTDFTPIAFIAQQPVVVVRANSPYRTLTDLVKAAQMKGGVR